MKEKTTITTTLGITHPEAAMLLGITRSQWSMYSSRKRRLPKNAQLLYDEMCEYLDAHDHKSKTLDAGANEAIQKELEKQLQEVEYQHISIIREMEVTAKKQEAQSNMVLIAEFFESRQADKKETRDLSEILSRKADKALKATVALDLAKQQHKLDLLLHEKSLLEDKLQKLRAEF